MALTGKLGADIEINAPAAAFYNVWKSQCHHLPNATPSNMQAVEVHEGDWETAGSIKLWNYTVAGRSESYKERIEVDDETMTVGLVGLEGDVFKNYKSWKPIIQVIPKESGSLLKLTLEYEKRSEDVPVPNEYLDFMVSVMTDLAAHLTKA
ncbi:hypothetical protein Patl1_15429 [Pistacia atlantica]|uniref:Uncharacterized protein n=1 Tax=Pistacia atlantica TaxID=434234 RepID=A0ACC1BA52_9ROSI|nr:hypothetical protein Patl1_15429 [Pistacia atlantica]